MAAGDDSVTRNYDNRTSNPSSGEKIPLYLGTFFSLGGNWEGGGIVPAVEMALSQVNERDDVLLDYELRMVWNDTQCESGVATRVFFHQLQYPPTKIMILGPPCSPGSRVMAETGVHWNLLVLSYSAASPALSNREKYPYYFRTYIPDTAFNAARVRLIKDFGWNRVATIHENYPIFSLAIDDLLTQLKQNNITVIKSESFSENPKNQIENLKNSDAKIIITNTYATKARRIFCEAYKQGMTGPDYVWFLIGWYMKSWWEIEDDTIDCTNEEIIQVVKSSFYISTEPLPLSPSDDVTIADITAAEFEKMYLERMEWPENKKYNYNELAPYGYDAVWAIALMLNETLQVLESKIFSDNSTRRLEDFNYDDNEMAMIFFEKLSESNFIGTSGPVTFKNGDRQGLIKVEQLQAICPTKWIVSNSSCYYLGHETTSWSQARERCIEEGGDLVVITHSNVHSFLTEQIQKDKASAWFIGLKYDNGFKWIDGKSLEFTPETNVPMSEPTRDDLCVQMDSNGLWETTSCELEIKFICEADVEYAENTVAFYLENGDKLEYVSNFYWPDGQVPLDHTPEVVITIIERFHGVVPELYFGSCAVAVLGILMALFFLCFNIKYREQRYVKMSSPNLNNIIILGTILVYSAVFFFGLDNQLVDPYVFEIICQIRVWVISVGFVIAFGAMFSKTWRVHQVASLKTPKRRVVTDKHLFIMVLILVLIDVVILSVWQIMDPMKRMTEELIMFDDPDVANQMILPISEYCSCDNLTYWMGALYCYKGLLLIFGTFLAWETRKVTIAALNDSKYIGMSVYNVIILCLIGASVSPIIKHNANAAFAFLAAIDIFCNSVTLLMVFIPKIISVCKYPEGQAVTTMKTRTAASEASSAKQADIVDMQERIAELEAENANLQNVNTKGSANTLLDLNDHKRGCGVWCFGAMCGCYSPARKGAVNKPPESDKGTHSVSE
ncbi:gamma-aminobutyric acid type B receptor subunit 2-like [Glandiceps talaboti]